MPTLRKTDKWVCGSSEAEFGTQYVMGNGHSRVIAQFFAASVKEHGIIYHFQMVQFLTNDRHRGCMKLIRYE